MLAVDQLCEKLLHDCKLVRPRPGSANETLVTATYILLCAGAAGQAASAAAAASNAAAAAAAAAGETPDVNNEARLIAIVRRFISRATAFCVWSPEFRIG